jgi:hypothetical protein
MQPRVVTDIRKEDSVSLWRRSRLILAETLDLVRTLVEHGRAAHNPANRPAAAALATTLFRGFIIFGPLADRPGAYRLLRTS